MSGASKTREFPHKFENVGNNPLVGTPNLRHTQTSAASS